MSPSWLDGRLARWLADVSAEAAGTGGTSRPVERGARPAVQPQTRNRPTSEAPLDPGHKTTPRRRTV